MVTFFEKSLVPVLNSNLSHDKIYLIEYIGDLNSSPSYKENVIESLKTNANNPNIERIYLLVDEIYSPEQIGLYSYGKIGQIKFNKAPTYAGLITIAQKNLLNGIVIFSYFPSYFNESIININKVEYNKLTDYFAISSLSNDQTNSITNGLETFIIHTDLLKKFDTNTLYCFNILMNQPLSTQKFNYLMKILGYQVFNCPELIKINTLPNNSFSEEKEKIPAPFVYVIPETTLNNQKTNELIALTEYSLNLPNTEMYNYLMDKINKNENFIIPKISIGIENQAIFLANEMKPFLNNQEVLDKEFKDIILDYIPKLKLTAGINCTNLLSLLQFYEAYLDAFNNSEIYLKQNPTSENFMMIDESQEFILETFSQKSISSSVLDIFNYARHNNPWTFALKGKKILLITPYIDSIKTNIEKQELIYGKNFFPSCSFTFLKSPITWANCESNDWMTEFIDFCNKINGIKDDFDIALVSCGGYSNPLLSYLLSIGKSGINVGSVLQMYWGVYGEKWILEKPDIIALYSNNNWIRPLDSDKPDKQYVSGSVYW